jgi:hypothetical protein
MPRSLPRLPALLLSLLLAAPACGPEIPTLLVDVGGIPDMAGRLQVTISNSGRTSSAVAYGRDSSNKFVTPQPAGMPPMAPAPASIQVAFDLPDGTTGTVKVSVLAEVGGMMMPLTVTHTGCGTTDVTGGGLYNVKVQLTASMTATCQ